MCSMSIWSVSNVIEAEFGTERYEMRIYTYCPKYTKHDKQSEKLQCWKMLPQLGV